MSRYKLIQTEFRNPASLLAALADLGLTPQQSPDLTQNTLPLANNYNRLGNQHVAILVDRRQLYEQRLGYFGHLGFAWNGSSYDLVQDDMDAYLNVADRLRQRYALNEIRQQARIKGYTVREASEPDGSIRLILTRR